MRRFSCIVLALLAQALAMTASAMPRPIDAAAGPPVVRNVPRVMRDFGIGTVGFVVIALSAAIRTRRKRTG